MRLGSHVWHNHLMLGLQSPQRWYWLCDDLPPCLASHLEDFQYNIHTCPNQHPNIVHMKCGYPGVRPGSGRRLGVQRLESWVDIVGQPACRIGSCSRNIRSVLPSPVGAVLFPNGYVSGEPVYNDILDFQWGLLTQTGMTASPSHGRVVEFSHIPFPAGKSGLL